MSQTEPQFKLRLPEDLLNQVKADALANGRSVNAEIVMRLRERDTPLRDWFAGQVLSGVMASAEEHFCGNGRSKEAVAEWHREVESNWATFAYRMADAMLKAREGR